MKILLISTYRSPTKNNGGNGLGRHVYDFMKLLNNNKDEVHIFCHPGSTILLDSVKKFDYIHPKNDLIKIYSKIKNEKYDLIIDNCHHKFLSKACKKHNLPIINFIHDTECNYQAPNILLGNTHQLKQHPGGFVVPTGIIFDEYEPQIEKEDYYCFVGKIEKRKGIDLAVEIQKRTGKRIIFVGGLPPYEKHNYELLKDQEWLGEITDNKKLKNIISKSKGLLYLSRLDAGGLAIWEASALGTQTFVISGTGTSCNIIDGVNGYVCENIDDIIEKIKFDKQLDPIFMRKETQKKWDLKQNFKKVIYPLFEDFVYNNRRW